MKNLALSIALLVSIYPAADKAHATQTSSTVPFHISSIGTGFAMQGEIDGEYHILPDRIELNITKAVVRISDHCPYKGERVLSAVSFALATETADKRWDVIARSEKFYVERVMKPGDEYALASMQFSIPIKDIDLTKHWLVAQFDDNVLNGRDTKGFAFAHSCKDIFSRAAY